MIDNNFSHFLRKSYDILTFMETQPLNTKGVKTFTIMPLKKGFVMSYITICTSCLQEILQSIVKKNPGVSFLGCSNFPKGFFSGDDEKKERFWKGLFRVSKCETKKRKFAYSFQTDGYAVSVLLRKPKPKCEEQPPPNVPWEQDFTRFVAIDPGKTYLATARTHTGEFIQMPTKQYYSDCKILEQKKWMENFKARNKTYAELIKNMPSFGTANLANYMERLQYVLKHCDTLFDICADNNGFRKWRFKVYRFTQKTLHKMCMRITNGGEKTCVGFGDWSQQDSFVKGLPSAPVKKFRKALERYATVIMIDEYHTSKGCSACRKVSMEKGCRYWKKKKPDDGKKFEVGKKVEDGKKSKVGKKRVSRERASR